MWGMGALSYCGNCKKNRPHNVAISHSNFIAFSAKIIRTDHKKYECHLLQVFPHYVPLSLSPFLSIFNIYAKLTTPGHRTLCLQAYTVNLSSVNSCLHSLGSLGTDMGQQYTKLHCCMFNKNSWLEAGDKNREFNVFDIPGVKGLHNLCEQICECFHNFNF